ncbi:MAG: energy-coupling factor transporter transmembrane protein EcfT [Roseiflexus sp.]|nr:energy-coupling factor transporter transmembrane protein EcfT [Roseiflexus sp.]MCS7288484.1 energy-coupling factor transporter transmembrane protein EcfT [Roseiflexus sp.]MDW8234053.1 energy-coupling factor transporter transmembrane component T [Roseiflexaceae bacterium]
MNIELRFDPRAKALAYLIGSAAIILTLDLIRLAVLSGVLAALLIGSGLGRRWLRVMRVLLPTLLLFALVAGWSGGYEAAIGAALRLAALVGAGVVFFGLTPPEELGDALLASGIPSQMAFLLEGALRFTPMMGTLAREVYEAQASRGIRFDGRHLLRNGPLLLTPLLLSVVRFADELAEGLETRGFGSPQRTPLREHRLNWRDGALVGVTLLLTILFVW